MKALVFVLMVGLTGCASMMNDPNLADQLQQSNQQINQGNRVMAESPAKNVDMQCEQTCMAKGFLLGFCEKQCSY